MKMTALYAMSFHWARPAIEVKSILDRLKHLAATISCDLTRKLFIAAETTSHACLYYHVCLASRGYWNRVRQ